MNYFFQESPKNIDFRCLKLVQISALKRPLSNDLQKIINLMNVWLDKGDVTHKKELHMLT